MKYLKQTTTGDIYPYHEVLAQRSDMEVVEEEVKAPKRAKQPEPVAEPEPEPVAEVNPSENQDAIADALAAFRQDVAKPTRKKG